MAVHFTPDDISCFEEELTTLLYSDRFTSNPLEWFSSKTSLFLSYEFSAELIELIVDRLHELGVLGDVCKIYINKTYCQTFPLPEKIIGRVPLHYFIQEEMYHNITPLLKYPECWEATSILSTVKTTAISESIMQICLAETGIHRPMEFNLLEKLLSTENPYTQTCLMKADELFAYSIDETFIYLQLRPYIAVDYETMERCEELVELRRKESGDTTKRAV